MSSINRFPWQDDILRGLHKGDAASICCSTRSERFARSGIPRDSLPA